MGIAETNNHAPAVNGKGDAAKDSELRNSSEYNGTKMVNEHKEQGNQLQQPCGGITGGGVWQGGKPFRFGNRFHR